MRACRRSAAWDREWQVIFINGRPCGSPVVNYAIQTAYRNVLPGGRYAPIFMHIQLPPDLVDVNVHPAKKEVRFRRPTEVRDVIIEALRLAISGTTCRRRSNASRPPRRPRRPRNPAKPCRFLPGRTSLLCRCRRPHGCHANHVGFAGGVRRV